MCSLTSSDIEATGGHGARPPVDDDILQGRPPTAWHDFKHAKLRQFPRYGAKIKWLEYLGHGEQGIVYRATIGDNNPVAVKVFWRTRRPKPQPLPTGKGFRDVEWPFEDESRTVALIEKVKWAMTSVETDPDQTILINRGPKTRIDAIKNLYAFSDEARRSIRRSTRQDLAPPPAFPPLPICYGWTRIMLDELPLLHPQVWIEVDKQFDWYWAIVYEFVPGAIQNLAIGQMHLDFFLAVGFALEAYKPDNWHGGRLIDLNDICSPFTRGWFRTSVRYRDAQEWFWTLDFVRGPVTTRKIIRRPNTPREVGQHK